MATFQVWLVRTLPTINPVGHFMHTHWGWPTAESIHFIGLSLLIGTIALFDLRLLGMAKQIPIAALHKLIPFGVLGYGINVVSGSMFLMTEPDQYIYNPAFQFKLLFMGLAGVNIVFFYLAVYPRAMKVGPSQKAPRSAMIIGAVSLCLWVAVIVCGRLLTFYRPGPCGPAGPGVLADCVPRTR